MSKDRNGLTERQRNNCRILAEEILPDVPDKHFNMEHFSDEGPKDRTNFCGTSGCAMGWAAMSGRIEGLQWCAPKRKGEGWATTLRDADLELAEPFYDDKQGSWGDGADKFFGMAASNYVFSATHINKAAAIRRLLVLANGQEPDYPDEEDEAE
jgi:hypothetical protein